MKPKRGLLPAGFLFLFLVFGASLIMYLLGLALINYPEAWALPFAILAALILIGLVILGWRRKQVSLLMPGGSYWLEWPLLFSLIGLGLLWLFPETDSASWRQAGLLALSAAGGFDLTIEAASAGEIRAIVRNYAYGLPQIPGFRYDVRPADRMPLAREFLPKNRTDTVLVSRTYAFGQQE